MSQTTAHQTPNVLNYFQGTSFTAPLLAKHIMKYDEFVTMRDTEEIFYYDSKRGIYLPNGDTYIKEKANKILGIRSKTSWISETVEAVRRATYRTRTSLIANNNLIVVKNGLIDVNTRVLYPFDSTHFSTSALPVDYDPNAKCPKIKKFLSEVVEPDVILTLQEFSGYCLMQGYRYQKALMIYGPGGNGKSTFLKLLGSFLGQQNISSVALQDLGQRFSSSDLYGKKANICDDLSSKDLSNSGIFKELTSGGFIRAEKKFKDAYLFKNGAKLVFATNSIPRIKDHSDAFYRRWLIADFMKVFTPGVNDDPNLIDKLTTEAELSGFLNWALDGYDRLKKNGRFSGDKGVKGTRRKWKALSERVYDFLFTETEYDITSIIPKTELYAKYQSYCIAKGSPMQGYQSFCRIVLNEPEVYDTRSTINGERVQCFIGIKFCRTGQG